MRDNYHKSLAEKNNLLHQKHNRTQDSYWGAPHKQSQAAEQNQDFVIENKSDFSHDPDSPFFRALSV